MDILLALFVTLGSELLVLSVFFFKDIKVLITMSVTNIVLNVTMNLLIGFMPTETAYYVFLVLFEIGTVALEALVLIFLNKKPIVKSISASLLANSLSLGIGMLINHSKTDIKTKTILIIIFVVMYAAVIAANLCFYLLDKKKD